MPPEGRRREAGVPAFRLRGRAPAAAARSAHDARVLVVDRQMYQDGAARVVLQLVDRWLASDVRVRLFVFQRSRPGEGAAIPDRVRPLYPSARRELRLRWALLWGFARLLPLARRADVVLAGRELGLALPLAAAAAKVVRRPFAVLVQSDPLAAMVNYESARMRPAVRWALRSADRLICVSPGLVPTVQALGVGLDRIAVAPNGIDVDAALAEAAGPPPELPDGDGPLVVAVGRLAHQKGFDLLVRAHAQVVTSGVRHRLLILGEGPDRETLEQLARDLGVETSVHLPGFVDSPLPVLAAADLFCLSSRWEGFGLSLAEALVVGTPSVATDCVSGPRLLLADGAHGDLVPVEDVDALAAAIERHLRDPERLRDRAAQGQRWATSTLDVRQSAATVLDELRAVAVGPAPSAHC